MPGLIPIHSGEIFLDAVTDNSYFPDIEGVIPADVDCTHRSKMWGKAGRENVQFYNNFTDCVRG